MFREPVVTEDQQKEMMARAYRRQEELKKLAENNDDDYMHSPWADSGALKRSLTGMGNIKFGPRWKHPLCLYCNAQYLQLV